LRGAEAARAAKHTRHERKHHPSLDYCELRAFIAELAQHAGVSMLQICILTCTRTSEVLGMRWDELKLDRAEWLIPAEA
jgi:integrase